MKAWCPNCCVCGRFCGAGADYDVPFGGPSDMEPPDEQFYCARCAAREEAEAVSSGFVPSPWIKARWQRRAAQRLGMVVAGPHGAAWDVFCHPQQIPADWEKRA